MMSGVVELDFVFSGIFLGCPTSLFAIFISFNSFGYFLGLFHSSYYSSPPGVAFLSFKLIMPLGTSL
jgi:hypothetical protein